jgi:uncharacterized protein
MKEQVERICISVNTKCNLSCKYCYFFNPENKVKTDNELSSEEILEILEKIDEYSKNDFILKDIKVNFVGSGEPLLSWSNIKKALYQFKDRNNNKIKFYIVTNGTLLNRKIVEEMIDLDVFPSISLDGYKKLHDKNRITYSNNGSFNKVMKGVKILKEKKLKVAINTTVTKDLVVNIEDYFSFLKENNINKVTFDRLVDTPSNFEDMSYDNFYNFLSLAYNIRKNMQLEDTLEIGNLESYKKNFRGNIDKVCTMFGSTCGAGVNFLIYMLKEVYPCGRMFGKSEWKLGHYLDDITALQNNMYNNIPKKLDCINCNVAKYCFRDCILEHSESNYSCDSRKSFIKTFSIKLM